MIRCPAMLDFEMTLQRTASRKCQFALFADELDESAAILVRQKVRMRASQVVNQTSQSRKLASTAITCLLESTLVQLSFVNLQCLCTAKQLATLVTAVFNGSEMNGQDVIFQLCLVMECP